MTSIPNVPETPDSIKSVTVSFTEDEIFELELDGEELTDIKQTTHTPIQNYTKDKSIKSIQHAIKIRWWQLKAMDNLFPDDNPYKPLYHIYLNDLSYIHNFILNFNH